MSIEVRIAGEDELKRWDGYVNDSPYGTIFHSLDWLKIVEKHTNTKLYPLIGYNGEEAVGLFPIFYKKKGLLKMVFSPPPKVAVPYLGYIPIRVYSSKQSKAESIYNDFIKQCDNFIHGILRSNYTLLKSSIGVLDARQFKWAGYHVEPIYTYIINLSDDDTQWKKFNESLRRDIKKATKKHVIVREGSKEELYFIYDLAAKRYQDQNRKFPITKDYFQDICNFFYPNNVKVFIAELHEKPISGIVLICYKNIVYTWIGLPIIIFQGVPINNLVQWELIRWAYKSNFRYYDMVGANTQRICQFKSKYNPELQIFFQIQKATFIGKNAEKLYLNIIKKIESFK